MGNRRNRGKGQRQPKRSDSRQASEPVRKPTPTAGTSSRGHDAIVKAAPESPAALESPAELLKPVKRWLASHKLIAVPVAVLTALTALSSTGRGLQWWRDLLCAPSKTSPTPPTFTLETRFDWSLGPAGMSAEEVRHLARNILTIANDNDVPLQGIEARLQLPEPIVRRPQVTPDFAGSDVRFRAISGGTLNVRIVGEGASVKLTHRDGTPYEIGSATTPALVEEEPMVDKSYGSFEYANIATPTNTGIWDLRIGSLPARHHVRIEFITSDADDAALYRGFARSCRPHPTGTACFLTGRYSFADGAKTVSPEFFRPIAFEPPMRQLALLAPAGRKEGIKLELQVPAVFVADSDVVR